MANSHLSSDIFMTELTLMFHNTRSKGEVTMTMKRYDGRTKPHPKQRRLVNGQVTKPNPLPMPDEYSCLLRAKCKTKKISTVVSAVDALRFQGLFAQFLRSTMDGLKKEKKVKKKDTKATQ